MTPNLEGKLEKNVYLASLTSEISIILGDYWEETFKLSEDQLEAIKDFEAYLKRAEKGKYYIDHRKEIGLNIDETHIGNLKALQEVMLISDTPEKVNNFLKISYDILKKVKEQKEIDKEFLWDYKKLLIKFGGYVSQRIYHPDVKRPVHYNTHDLWDAEGDD